MSTETATATPAIASPKAAKVKAAPTPAVTPLVAALTKALAQASKAKPAKVFDEDGFRKDMAKHGLPSAFIDNAARESKKKFEAEHGSNGEQQTRALLTMLAPALGGIDEVSSIVGRMAKEARSAGKLSITAGQFKLALDGDKEGLAPHRAICERAAELRAGGKGEAWSTIANTLNLAPSTQQALYTVAKEYADLFTEHATTKA